MSTKTLLVLGALLAIGAVALPIIGTTSNCGGNSAALSHVHTYALFTSVGTDVPVNELRAQLSYLTRNHWLPGAHFLVSTVPVQPNESRRIVIVCDTPYRNVPRRLIGSAPATHAAGFSDGSASLISPAEFADLDRSHFIALDELYPTSSK